MIYRRRTIFGQSGALENIWQRETKIGPAAIPGVRSFSQRSPQILGILSARNSRRELCPRAKWRREKCWQPTLSTGKLLILNTENFRRFKSRAGIRTILGGNLELRLPGSRSKILADPIARQSSSPLDLPDWYLLAEMPAPDNAQKCHVDHSVIPRSKCQGEDQSMGYFSVETCVPPRSTLNANQQT